jgi:hypothetical protein
MQRFPVVYENMTFGETSSLIGVLYCTEIDSVRVWIVYKFKEIVRDKRVSVEALLQIHDSKTKP